jgi:hypothetical protein
MVQASLPARRPAVPRWWRKLLKHPMVAAVIGAAVGAILTVVLPFLFGPLPSSTVTDLMNQEAWVAARKLDIAQLNRIYAPDAVVTDAGCQTPGASTVWTGFAQIAARYNALPAFSSIEHVNVHVNWEPPFLWATKADATAETIGVIVSSGGSQQSQFIVGHEQWTFASENGQWVITSFTYNLCLS